MGFYGYRVCECFWLGLALTCPHAACCAFTMTISFSGGQTSASSPQLRDLISFWCRYPHHLKEVRHPRRDIPCFYVCVAIDPHSFFYLSKIVKTSLAYHLKQRECFAWIRSLTFVEFCKCKLSEGYWYFWYLCCIFSMMYLCLRNHAGRRRNFSITHCTTRWYKGPF